MHASDDSFIFVVVQETWDIVIYLLSYLGMYLFIEQPNQEIDNTITRYYILSST